MIPGQATLKINGVWRLDRSICTEFNGRSLPKSSGGHDDITVIARHSPWLRGHIAVYRCCCLYALAEGYHGIAVIELYSLYDIVAAFSTVRNHLKTKLFIDFCGKDCSL